MAAVLGFCSIGGGTADSMSQSLRLAITEMREVSSHRKPIPHSVVCDGTWLNGFETNDYLVSFAGRIFNRSDVEPGANDSERMLNTFRKNGIAGINALNGNFAGAIYDKNAEKLYLFRDHMGIEPLYYTFVDGILVFASETTALFKFPGFTPVLDIDGLRRIFALGPVVEEGNGVLKGVYSVLPGNYIEYGKDGLTSVKYWGVKSASHTDSFSETVEKTAFLLRDSVLMRMKTDGKEKLCSFLSGGLDSGVVTAIMAEQLRNAGRKLDTFSLDFEGNDDYFAANDFQPERDLPYALKTSAFLNTVHCPIECNNPTLFGYLSRALLARGVPGMADIDSSLMFFCDAVKQTNDIAITGEGSDEIFAGYPWFHKDNGSSQHAALFPWSRDIKAREALLTDEFIEVADLSKFAEEKYNEAVAKTPYLEGESSTERKKREISYLTMKWFMPTLVDRSERMGALSGLSIRMPFADKRLVEYIWNVPYEMKTKDGVVKGLLRQASKGLLPDELLFRKKSPFPKTYNPLYTEALSLCLNDMLDRQTAVSRFVDKEKLKNFCVYTEDYGKPWFGQLMAGPQMLAYLIQINDWIEKNNITIGI